MRVWDESLLSGQAELEYVKDGMRLWLDGINNTRNGHNASSSYWEDLSGNGYDAYIRPNGYGRTDISCMDNCYNFNYSASFGHSWDLAFMSIASFAESSAVMFEVVIAPSDMSSTMMILQYNPRYMNLMFRDGTKLSGGGNGWYTPYVNLDSSTTLNKINTFGFSKANPSAPKYYKNGAEVQGTGSVSYYADGNGLVIGAFRGSGDVTNSFFNGNIYCIRIYNRQLTAEEIAQNAAVDSQRFGAGR